VSSRPTMRSSTYKQRYHHWVRHNIAKQKTKKRRAVRRSWGYIQPLTRVRVNIKGLRVHTLSLCSFPFTIFLRRSIASCELSNSAKSKDPWPIRRAPDRLSSWLSRHLEFFDRPAKLSTHLVESLRGTMSVSSEEVTRLTNAFRNSSSSPISKSV